MHYPLFSKECYFVIGAKTLKQIPPTHLPEIAFIGRSNVGKSSLINALLNRKNLAKVSQTPGRTRQINFFNLANTMHIVDLPGYGFAKTSKTERADFNQLVADYLTTSQHLKRLFVLIDARHAPKENDLSMLDWLNNHAVPYQVVLTKIDKTPQKDLTAHQAILAQLITCYGACHPDLLCISSHTKNGITELQKSIMAIIDNQSNC